MRKALTAAVLILAAVATLGAQAIPAGKVKKHHPWNDKRWLIGRAVEGVAIALDYGSTYRLARTGHFDEVRNPFLTVRPTAKRAVGVGLINFSFDTLLDTGGWYLMHDDKNTAWRAVSQFPLGISGGTAAIHFYGAAHNLELLSQCHAAHLSGC